MVETQDDFAALLALARTGDSAALAQLAQQYETKIRIVARTLLGPALRPYLDSIDLVQSVHRSLLIGLRSNKFALASPENLVALAVTMVRRKVARQWRRCRRQQRLETVRGDSQNLPQLLVSLCSPQPTPARQAEFEDAVRHLFDQLGTVDQQVLDLRLQGYDGNEVARKLGLNPTAVRVRLSRLRQRLRAAAVFDDWF